MPWRAPGTGPTARALHERLLDLFRVNFISPNPVPVKAALAEMGLIEDVLRQPLLPLADEQRARLVEVLTAAGVLPAPAGDTARRPVRQPAWWPAVTAISGPRIEEPGTRLAGSRRAAVRRS